MALKFALNGIAKPGHYNINAPAPVDGRIIAEYQADLLTVPFAYQGLETVVLFTGNAGTNWNPIKYRCRRDTIAFPVDVATPLTLADWEDLTTPSGGLVYKGAWDATANLPNLNSADLRAALQNGEYYRVSKADAVEANNTIVDGNQAWKSQDWVVWSAAENKFSRILSNDTVPASFDASQVTNLTTVVVDLIASNAIKQFNLAAAYKAGATVWSSSEAGAMYIHWALEALPANTRLDDPRWKLIASTDYNSLVNAPAALQRASHQDVVGGQVTGKYVDPEGLSVWWNYIIQNHNFGVPQTTDDLTDVGSNNLYFTNARAIGAKLTGYVKANAARALATADSILTALGILEFKIDKNATAIGNLADLQTSAKGNLVSALNEVKNSAGSGTGTGGGGSFATISGDPRENEPLNAELVALEEKAHDQNTDTHTTASKFDVGTGSNSTKATFAAAGLSADVAAVIKAKGAAYVKLEGSKYVIAGNKVMVMNPAGDLMAEYDISEEQVAVPATLTAAGIAGTWAADDSFLYFCTYSNTVTNTYKWLKMSTVSADLGYGEFIAAVPLAVNSPGEFPGQVAYDFANGRKYEYDGASWGWIAINTVF